MQGTWGSPSALLHCPGKGLQGSKFTTLNLAKYCQNRCQMGTQTKIAVSHDYETRKNFESVHLGIGEKKEEIIRHLSIECLALSNVSILVRFIIAYRECSLLFFACFCLLHDLCFQIPSSSEHQPICVIFLLRFRTSHFAILALIIMCLQYDVWIADYSPLSIGQ